MRISRVYGYGYSIQANYSPLYNSTLHSILAPITKSYLYSSTSSSTAIDSAPTLMNKLSNSTWVASTIDTTKPTTFTSPFHSYRSNAPEPHLKKVEFDKRRCTKSKKRPQSPVSIVSLAQFDNPIEKHEPHCPLFKSEQNRSINDHKADSEKKFSILSESRNKTNLQKSCFINSPHITAKELVDKYFDG